MEVGRAETQREKGREKKREKTGQICIERKEVGEKSR